MFLVPLTVMQKFLPILALVLILLAGCSSTDTTTNPTRNFYMGVTPWPADFNLSEVQNTYSFIAQNCDIVSHHFDDGIPYEEAFTNTALPVEIQNDVTYRKNNTPAHCKILLSVSALDLNRTAKAVYHPKSIQPQSVKDNWMQKAFSNPDVVLAYTHYLEWLIDSFEPDYINFGVESNSESWSSSDFTSYKSFIGQVYQNLKTNHPNIPLFVSFMVNENPLALSRASQLLPYTDYLALSAYPYLSASYTASGSTNPDLMPENYFSQYLDLAPEKKIAFAETGYAAQNVVVPEFNLNKQANAEWQNKYLSKILELCQNKNAVFLIWFCYKDYDAAVVSLQNMNLYNPLVALWKDIGFKDENNTNRIAYQTWTAFKSRPFAD